ncbi:MAG: hypothetical protein ACN6PR_05770, partial [Achromobacter sp.]
MLIVSTPEGGCLRYRSLSARHGSGRETILGMGPATDHPKDSKASFGVFEARVSRTGRRSKIYATTYPYTWQEQWKMAKVGMVGIGLMGHGIASNLVKHG